MICEYLDLAKELNLYRSTSRFSHEG